MFLKRVLCFDILYHSLHYQVFYALYLYENSFSDIETKPSLSDKQQSPGQQSLWKYGCVSRSILTSKSNNDVDWETFETEIRMFESVKFLLEARK